MQRSGAARHTGRIAVVTTACLIAATGCSRPGAEITATAAEKLSPKATAYVALPEDGRFGTRVYAGSGREVAALVAGTLAPRLRRIEVADAERGPRATLARARAQGFTYLIRPSILRWEDHAAAWSGSPDRAEVLIEVIDTASGNAADVAVVKTSADGTLATDAAATPAAALEAPLEAYAARLLPAMAATARK